MQLPGLLAKLRRSLHRSTWADLDDTAALDLHLVYRRLGQQQTHAGAVLSFLRSDQNPVPNNNQLLTLGFHVPLNL